MLSFVPACCHLKQSCRLFDFHIGSRRVRQLRLAGVGLRLQSTKRGYSIRASAAQAHNFKSQRESDKLRNDAQAESVDSLESVEDTRKESLVLLEWPALCQQVAAFASTPMAAQRILLSGLPFGRSKVKEAALAFAP